MSDVEFVRVYGMGDEASRDVLVRPKMAYERIGALGVPMTHSRIQNGYTMRRDRLADLQAACQHQQIGFKYDKNPPKWTEDECKAGWGRIKHNIEAALDDWIQFVRSEGWKALGYRTLGELCDAELFGIRFPAIPQRQAAVKTMTEAGMSEREIAVSTGHSERTIRRDRAALRPRQGGTNVPPSGPPIEGVVVNRDVPQWTAPRRDPAHLMAYQEGMTDVPPPPDLLCVQETLKLLWRGEDLIPHDPLLDLYRASRNACSRLGLIPPAEREAR